MKDNKNLNNFLKNNMQKLISFRTKDEIKNFLKANGFKLGDNDLQNLAKNFNINSSDRTNLSLNDLKLVAGGGRGGQCMPCSNNPKLFNTRISLNSSGAAGVSSVHAPSHFNRAGKDFSSVLRFIPRQVRLNFRNSSSESLKIATIRKHLYEKDLLNQAEMRRQIYRSYDCDILKSRIKTCFSMIDVERFKLVAKAELKQERFKKNGVTKSLLVDRLSDATDRFGPECFSTNKAAKFIELTFKNGKTCTLDKLL